MTAAIDIRTRSPLGFDAGDGNLYRYVANDPTNATDPSGLKKLEHTGRFEFGKDKREIGIRVWSDVDYDGPGWIELRLSEGEKPLDADFHWLQFVYRIRRKGKDIQPGGRIFVNEKYCPYADKLKGYMGDAMAVDTVGKEEIFYDKSGGYKMNRLGDLSIFDRPTVDEITEGDLKAKDFSEIRVIADAFVVDDGRVYYHVHWERVGYYDGERWTMKYENISGEPVKDGKLPARFFTKDGQLFGGYGTYDRDAKKFEEPIYFSFPPKK
jgi:hypothetical protein